MTNVRELMKTASEACAKWRQARFEYDAAEKALAEARKAIVAGGGTDIGLKWPLRTILTGNPEMGRINTIKYRLDLSYFGVPVLRRLKSDGADHKGVNDVAFESERCWIEVAS